MRHYIEAVDHVELDDVHDRVYDATGGATGGDGNSRICMQAVVVVPPAGAGVATVNNASSSHGRAPQPALVIALDKG